MTPTTPIPKFWVATTQFQRLTPIVFVNIRLRSSVVVHTPDIGFCLSSSHVNVTHPVGYIVGQIPSRGVSCDRSVHPWIITAERGQRINVTLFDFALDSATPRRGATDRDKVACRQYGWLEDSASERLVPLCGGYEARVKDIYFSKGHSVKIWTLTDDKRDEIKRFLIRYSGSKLKFIYCSQQYSSLSQLWQCKQFDIQTYM